MNKSLFEYHKKKVLPLSDSFAFISYVLTIIKKCLVKHTF